MTTRRVIPPNKRFRILRGEAAGYRLHYYATKRNRDAAAHRFAARDNDSVDTELWDETHPQDDLNKGWACDGNVLPPRPTSTKPSTHT